MVDLNNQIELIKQQTTYQAQNIIQHAKQDAEKIAQQGYSDGYQDGYVAVLSQIATYFGNCNGYLSLKRDELIEEVRGLLSSAIERPETLLSVIDEWTKSLPVSDEVLQINLPETSKKIETRLKDLLHSWPGKVIMSYHMDNKYVMSCGQQIAEFSPKEFENQAIEMLMPGFSLIPTELQRISDEALTLLSDYCKSMITERLCR